MTGIIESEFSDLESIFHVLLSESDLSSAVHDRLESELNFQRAVSSFGTPESDLRERAADALMRSIIDVPRSWQSLHAKDRSEHAEGNLRIQRKDIYSYLRKALANV